MLTLSKEAFLSLMLTSKKKKEQKVTLVYIYSEHRIEHAIINFLHLDKKMKFFFCFIKQNEKKCVASSISF